MCLSKFAWLINTKQVNKKGSQSLPNTEIRKGTLEKEREHKCTINGESERCYVDRCGGA